jgi:hypothetical protein
VSMKCRQDHWVISSHSKTITRAAAIRCIAVVNDQASGVSEGLLSSIPGVQLKDIGRLRGSANGQKQTFSPSVTYSLAITEETPHGECGKDK